MARWLHTLAAKLGLAGDSDPDPFVGNSLVSMYGQCGRARDAGRGKVPGSLERAHGGEAWSCSGFRDCLVGRNGCVAGRGDAGDGAPDVRRARMAVATGRAVHGLAVMSGWDVSARFSNVLVDMYAKCGERASPEEAPSVVSWNVMLGAYARSGEAGAAFGLVRQMQLAEGHGEMPPADEITVLSVLPACSGQPELGKLRELQAFTIRSVGDVGACSMLAGIRSMTVSSWNAQNSEASAAIELFRQMANACGLTEA